MSSLMGHGWKIPDTLVGTSAGAAIATACLTVGPEDAFDACLQMFMQNEKNVRFVKLLKGESPFAHQPLYEQWIADLLDEQGLKTIRRSKRRLRVAITRPAETLGVIGSIAVGTMCYLAAKRQGEPQASTSTRFGLRLDYVDLADRPSVTEARRLLVAAAAVAPLVRPHKIGGRYALDGGYVENVPLNDPASAELRTLVLLTRHYPNRTECFQEGATTFWQPSRPVPVSTWDCTVRTTVQAAFDLGRADGIRGIREWAAA